MRLNYATGYAIICDMDSSLCMINSPIAAQEAMKLHPMALAFIGDAVQALYTRTRVTVGSSSKTGQLHNKVIKVVKAVAQAQEAEALMPMFSEEEEYIFKRARNCKLQTQAKHAETGEYRRASGLEAVLGFLYLTGQSERLSEFLQIAFDEAVKGE